MARKIDTENGNSVSALTCSTCNEKLGEHTEHHRAWRLREGQALFHCDGSPVAFGAKSMIPHHTLSLWPKCWRCQLSLGCPKCVSCTADEVFCERCLAWGTLSAFLQHGPISNDKQPLSKRRDLRAPEARDYPEQWRRAYAKSEGVLYDLLNTPEANTAHTRRMIDVFSAAIPERYAAAILQKWQEGANARRD